MTERMAAIADDWTEIGQILKTATEADETGLREGLQQAATAIKAVADREEKLYADILSAE